MVDMEPSHPSNVYKAATAPFDIYNPAEALADVLALCVTLLNADRSALYEYDEKKASFIPRYSKGIALSDLGQIGSGTDHPILQEALNNRRAASTEGNHNSFGLPMAPGVTACAPCIASGTTIGLLFVARDGTNAFTPDALSTLEVLANRAAELLAFAGQMASQNYLLRRLTLLYKTSHAITGTRDRQEAIRQTANHLLKATSADFCEVLLQDGSEEIALRFRPRLDRTTQKLAAPVRAQAVPDYPAYQQVLQNLQPTILSITPPQGSPKDISLLQEEGIAAAAIFPLATRNQALGLVRLLYEQPGHRITEQEADLAQAIINIGAVGVQDALHLETAETRANHLQVLANIGREMTSTLEVEAALQNTMHYTQQFLQCEACVLFMLDEDGDNLILKASGGRHVRIRDVAIRLEEGIAGWVARNKRPLIVNDVQTNPLYQSAIDSQTGLLTSSVLCVPMESRGEVLGVIEAINHQRGSFNQTDQQALSSVAPWAAIALDNANLFQRVTEERSRLETTLVETADAVVLTDRSGKIVLINKAAANAFRINANLAVNRHVTDVFVDHPLGASLADESLECPRSIEVTTPTERVLFANISEIRNVGRVAVMQDITALKQIDRMRSQLLGTAAHDLKNPLNAIRLGADLLSDAPLSDQQRKALMMMQRATDNMTNLITGLLETIRLETTSNLASEECDLNQIILTAIEDLQPLADSKQHTIEYEPPSKPLILEADINRLGSVFSNLISNAIKFTPPNGKIAIQVTWDDEEIEVRVKDNGAGIPEDELPRIFEHLFRGRVTVEDPNNPIEGTGLGLALTKTVIEQHGGNIRVESKPSEGSTFIFTLPWEVTPKTGSLRPGV